MQLSLTINNEIKILDIPTNETLLRVLRRNGYFGVKHGCEIPISSHHRTNQFAQ